MRPSRIFILAGNFEQANRAARDAGLAPTRWDFLQWRGQLVGMYEPDVVMLATANEHPHFIDLMGDLNARSATCWTETDMINGKVPR